MKPNTSLLARNRTHAGPRTSATYANCSSRPEPMAPKEVPDQAAAAEEKAPAEEAPADPTPQVGLHSPEHEV